MNPTIACIRASAQWWATYKLWVVGDPQMRGYQMARSMRDIVMLGALYQAERKKAINRG